MRKHDWRSALSAELAEARKRKWKWGEHDCTSFAARCAEAMTGEPYVQRLKAIYLYDTAKSAAEFLRSSSLMELVSKELGEPIKWSQCRHGDLVLCAFDDPEKLFNQQLTVHDGAQLLAPRETGIMRVPFERAICGWMV